MRYLLDTGVLLRIPHRADPLHLPVRKAVRHLASSGHALVTARQCIVEFWSVCTRPATSRGGFNLSVDETIHRMQLLERIVEVLNEPVSSYVHWKTLVAQRRVIGRQVHDTRLVAVMKAYRIKRILTLNAADFQRFPEIQAISPDELVSDA